MIHMWNLVGCNPCNTCVTCWAHSTNSSLLFLLWNLVYCTHHYLPDRSRSSFVLTSNSMTRNKACFIKEIIIKHFISTASWINACNFCLHWLYGCKTNIFVLFMTWESSGTQVCWFEQCFCLISKWLKHVWKFWGFHIIHPLHLQYKQLSRSRIASSVCN